METMLVVAILLLTVCVVARLALRRLLRKDGR